MFGADYQADAKPTDTIKRGFDNMLVSRVVAWNGTCYKEIRRLIAVAACSPHQPLRQYPGALGGALKHSPGMADEVIIVMRFTCMLGVNGRRQIAGTSSCV